MGGVIEYNPEGGQIKEQSIKVWSQLGETYFKTFYLLDPMLKLCRLIQQSSLTGGIIGYSPERLSLKDHSIKVWSQLAK